MCYNEQMKQLGDIMNPGELQGKTELNYRKEANDHSWLSKERCKT